MCADGKCAVMSQNKTLPTDADFVGFLARIKPDSKAADALILEQLFRGVTGFQPRMWGPSIIGYGQYHFSYASGREGDFLATGFSPRKAAHSIYIMPGYTDFGRILSRIGKHKTGKSCLYVNKLEDIDLEVLADLITAGLEYHSSRWPVLPT